MSEPFNSTNTKKDIDCEFNPITIVRNRVKITQIPNGGGVWITAPLFSKKLNVDSNFTNEELISLADKYLETEDLIVKTLEEYLSNSASRVKPVK